MREVHKKASTEIASKMAGQRRSYPQRRREGGLHRRHFSVCRGEVAILEQPNLWQAPLPGKGNKDQQRKEGKVQA